MFSRVLHSRRLSDGRATRSGVGDLPMENRPVARHRLRRGGPRTPLPLVGLVAVCAGIGIAYIGQVAHSTQATYQASQLQAQQIQLRAQTSRLDDQLARLQATERIVAAAQSLGMRPPQNWAYVTSDPRTVVAKPHLQLASATNGSDPVQAFIASIAGAVGVGGSPKP